ncbi:hypothetical protein PR048_002982 [Dryococelus australis]|uniref:Uncharacterized protein n=1 Tax=Dryococelus australis TaxID=614101 RepID=A0ABQ9ILP5_9NEOP|nr:hypothetical protein PR048_002982 [Dryococelus australis]
MVFLLCHHSATAPEFKPAATNRKTISELRQEGAAVADRFDYSPPTKANRVQSPAGLLRTFASTNRAGRYRWSAGFLGDLPFTPLLHSGAAPLPPHFTIIGSQDFVAAADLEKWKPKLCGLVRAELRWQRRSGLRLRGAYIRSSVSCSCLQFACRMVRGRMLSDSTVCRNTRSLVASRALGDSQQYWALIEHAFRRVI